MTTLHEAAQQALEALESSRVFVMSREKIKHPEGTEWYDERITALRAALAENERDWSLLEATQESLREHMAEIQRLRAALAEPVQEPVAWRYVPSDVWGDAIVTQDPKTVELAQEYGRPVEPLYTAPPQRKPLTEEEAWLLIEQDYRMEEYANAAMELIRRTEQAHGIGGQDE